MSNSLITTESDLIEPIHPGEILMEDFTKDFGITQNKRAVSIGVPIRRFAWLGTSERWKNSG